MASRYWRWTCSSPYTVLPSSMFYTPNHVRRKCVHARWFNWVFLWAHNLRFLVCTSDRMWSSGLNMSPKGSEVNIHICWSFWQQLDFAWLVTTRSNQTLCGFLPLRVSSSRFPPLLSPCSGYGHVSSIALLFQACHKTLFHIDPIVADRFNLRVSLLIIF